MPPRQESAAPPSPVRPASAGRTGSDLRKALASCSGAFLGVGLFSGVSNILMLTGPFFMLEVYDRVLPSHSVPTLVALSVLALLLFLFQGIIDLIRSRVLVRISLRLDEMLGRRVLGAIIALRTRVPVDNGLQPLRDLDQIRGFLSSGGPTALFDLPWIPIYIAICFLFHPWLGGVVLGGAVALFMLTLVSDVATRGLTRESATFAAKRTTLTEAARRNAEVIQAMGMASGVTAQWEGLNRLYRNRHFALSNVTGNLGALSRLLRVVLQSATLALGAFLVLRQEASVGIIIASSILTARALAPLDSAITHWKGFVGARQSWHRLEQLFLITPTDREPMPLPRPSRTLAVGGLVVVPPGAPGPSVMDVSFTLKAGDGLGLVGPSASGKSSLARSLVGVWRPVRGDVRLDGATLDQWSPDALGAHVGYLPQDVELFDGTIRQNIARFAISDDPDAVIAAATAAGVHDLILALPDGYETRIGESGMALSGGQRQRVALARALYGDPFLVVLDEPNSNLDSEGVEALGRAVASVRARGGIVIVVAHHAGALSGTNLMLAMSGGRIKAFGPRETQANRMPRPTTVSYHPLKVIADTPEATS
ncbi:type I secretion system permease/ATPase (plasmid) [Azospirillum sp. 412522]|nr:type I secretion system permease/ATPase [Azospirillum sp. 412522]MBY6266410.1 type I secretion system permease/ATPase [Azospirillum sp. 412522]